MRSPGLADWGQGWRAGALLLLVLLVGVGAEILFGQEVYWAHDLRHHYHPWRHWVAETWSEGRLPLWCSQVANGFPLMADGQAGVFYAPYLVLGWLLPSHHALSFSILLHTAWAFLGARLLARDQGLDDAPSTLAAVAFAFSGFMSSHVTYAGMYAVASWLPWGVLSSQRISQRAYGARSGGSPWPPCSRRVTPVLPSRRWDVCSSSAPARAVWAAWAAAGTWALAGLMAASTQLLATIERRVSRPEREASRGVCGDGLAAPKSLNAILPRFWGWEPPPTSP